MFPAHNPAQQVFNWHCRSNNIPESNITGAAANMREHVYRIRKLYNMPIGRQIPYHDADFREAYMLAYFPYYIEPICHVLLCQLQRRDDRRQSPKTLPGQPFADRAP